MNRRELSRSLELSRHSDMRHAARGLARCSILASITVEGDQTRETGDMEH